MDTNVKTPKTTTIMGKPTYKIGRYVSIYRCDELGNKKELFMQEAQIGLRVREGKELIVRTIDPQPKEVSLGVIVKAQNYQKNSCVDVQTEQGWLHIVANEDLEWLLDDSIGL